MEWVWLFIAMLCLIGGVHAVSHQMVRKGLIFFIMFIMSLAMFYLRRYFRHKKKDKDL